MEKGAPPRLEEVGVGVVGTLEEAVVVTVVDGRAAAVQTTMEVEEEQGP